MIAQQDKAFLRQDLPNGATLLVRERPTSGVVAINVSVLAGSRDEPAEREGWTNLLTRAHVLGTDRWPTEDVLKRAVASTGGGISASANRELIQFSVTVPATEFVLAVAVLRDILHAPLFETGAIERDRSLVSQEIVRRLSEPSAVAIDTLTDVVWAGHPAGHSSLGTEETIQSAGRDELLAMRAALLTGSNITAALVGQVAPDVAFEALRGLLESLPAGERRLREKITLDVPESTHTAEKFVGQRQAQILIGVPTAGRTDPDRYPLLVLESVLGSPSGRMFRTIRTERGMAYSAGAGLSLLTDTGLFYASAGTDPENVDAVLELMDRELRRSAAEQIDGDTLSASIGQICGRRVMSEETSSAQANQLAALHALGGFETVSEFRAAVSAVTAADVQRVASTYLGHGAFDVIIRPRIPE